MISATVGVGLLVAGMALLGAELRLARSSPQAEVFGIMAAACLFFAVGFLLRGLGVETPLDQMLFPPPPPQ